MTKYTTEHAEVLVETTFTFFSGKFSSLPSLSERSGLEDNLKDEDLGLAEEVEVEELAVVEDIEAEGLAEGNLLDEVGLLDLLRSQ